MNLSALLKRAQPRRIAHKLASPLLAFTSSATNLSPRQRRFYRRMRYFLPRSYRYFFEGAPNVPGQMWAFERRLLFQTVCDSAPKVACESGTWLGGGSTYFIAAALKERDGGVLHTTEAEPHFYARATQYYARFLPELQSHVRFHEGKSTDVYASLLPEIGPIDFLLLDGAEDAEQTWQEWQMFEPFLSPDAMVVAHDWNTEKMALMRPWLENNRQWQIQHQLQPPLSVGMVVFGRATSVS